MLPSPLYFYNEKFPIYFFKFAEIHIISFWIVLITPIKWWSSRTFFSFTNPIKQMFTVQVIPAHLWWSIKHNTVLNSFIIIRFIFIPVLINYLCGKHSSFTTCFERNGSNWDFCLSVSGSHQPKQLIYAIKSSESSDQAGEVLLICSLSITSQRWKDYTF